jgi:hypothetical protein
MNNTTNKKNRLEARILPPRRIVYSDRERMFEIMQKYYDSVTREHFDRDLAAKHAVIVLRDLAHGKIQGFSTLMKVEIGEGRSAAVGFFSGDTVVEKEFWGQRTLGIAFLQFLWLEKIKNPLRPVYWFLISKGYKTYLLMANNFSDHYPRYEKPTPALQRRIMDEFYGKLYPGKYEPATGRVVFESCEGKLKEGVAAPSAELIASNPRVAYFEKQNPGWKNGDELACIAQMTLWMPLSYQLKALFKKSAHKATAGTAGSGRVPERRVRQVPVAVERRMARSSA